jgi:carboxymethylenebutenolidase
MSGTTAAALLAALSPQFAQAQKVAPTDPRLRTEHIDIPTPHGHGHLRALVARPAQGSAPLPVVLVIHENRGLNPHIEDIARRLALEGYLAVAPDGLTPQGGYPGDEDKAREAFARLDPAKAREDWIDAARHARTLAGSNGRLGAVGFCYGGSIVNLLAVRVPELAAGASFYGAPPPLADVPRIRAELAIFHAGNDQRLLASWPAYDAALKAAQVRHSATVYPGTEHGFHNDTTPRHDEKAARDAWAQTLALFQRTLRTTPTTG